MSCDGTATLPGSPMNTCICMFLHEKEDTREYMNLSTHLNLSTCIRLFLSIYFYPPIFIFSYLYILLCFSFCLSVHLHIPVCAHTCSQMQVHTASINNNLALRSPRGSFPNYRHRPGATKGHPTYTRTDTYTHLYIHI